MNLYYKNTNAFICFYDITRRDTFNNLDSWISGIPNEYDCIPKIILGLKCDLENRAVPNNEAIAHTRQKNFKYYEASSLNKANVNEIIVNIFTDLMITESIDSFSDEIDEHSLFSLD